MIDRMTVVIVFEWNERNFDDGFDDGLCDVMADVVRL
jgi:hypothetical protein